MAQDTSLPRLTSEREAETLMRAFWHALTYEGNEAAAKKVLELQQILDALRADVAAANARADAAERKRDAALSIVDAELENEIEYGQCRFCGAPEYPVDKRGQRLDDAVGADQWNVDHDETCTTHTFTSIRNALCSTPAASTATDASAKTWTPKAGDHVRVKADGRTGKIRTYRDGARTGIVFYNVWDTREMEMIGAFTADELEPAD